MLRFELLGPLQVVKDDHCLPIGAQKPEVVLATLLTRPNQVVSCEEIITELWGSQPPRRARAALHVYISHLRKLLACTDDGGVSPIITSNPGYSLTVPPDHYDVPEFDTAVSRARENARAQRWADALLECESALSRWRGQAAMSLRNGPRLNAFGHWLEDMYTEVVEISNESKLALGHHHEVIATLRSLLVEHPLRETWYVQLMHAYRSTGRRGDALAVYREARKILARELGLEPSAAIEKLHQAILHDTAAPPDGLIAHRVTP